MPAVQGKHPRPGRRARAGLARTLVAWEAAGHEVEAATVAALEVAAHGVDVALAQAVAGVASGRTATLAAAALATLVRDSAPSRGFDLDDAFRTLLELEVGSA